MLHVRHEGVHSETQIRIASVDQRKEVPTKYVRYILYFTAHYNISALVHVSSFPSAPGKLRHVVVHLLPSKPRKIALKLTILLYY